MRGRRGGSAAWAGRRQRSRGLCVQHNRSQAGAKADWVSRLCDSACACGDSEAHWRGSALARKRVRRSSRSCARSQYRSSSSCATSKKEELVARLGDALSNAEQPVEKRNFSKAEVLKMLDLPEMQNLLRQKRLRWVGHALRRKDGDLSKDTVKQELTRKSSTWTACVLSDMEALNIGSVVASEREANRESALAASRY